MEGWLMGERLQAGDISITRFFGSCPASSDVMSCMPPHTKGDEHSIEWYKY